MKFIGIADLHLSMYSQDPIIKGMPERLYYLNFVLRDIAEYAIAHSIENIVIAGDTFHTKSIIHSLAQSVLLDWIRDYNPKLTFWIIDGNHDMSSKSGEGVSALKCVDNEPNVVMMHEPKQVEEILFVPWHAKTMVKTIKENTSPFLVSHLGLNEAQLNSGISIISDIKIGDLRRYGRCIFGHYHAPQEIGNVIIPGSIIQLDWGEKHEEKRFLVVDTEADSVQSVPTTGYKKHYVIEITSENKEEQVLEAKKLQEEGHIVNLHRISGDVNVEDLREDFRIIDKVEKDITNRGIDSSMSTVDKLKRYMEIQEVPAEEQEAYLRCALDIIRATTGEEIECTSYSSSSGLVSV